MSWPRLWPRLDLLLRQQSRIVNWDSARNLRALHAECSRYGLDCSYTLNEKFVDLSSLVEVIMGRQCSLEEACESASIEAADERSSALERCRLTLRLVRAMRHGRALGGALQKSKGRLLSDRCKALREGENSASGAGEGRPEVSD